MSATTRHASSSRFCQGEIFYVMPEGETPDNETFYGGRPAIIVSNDMLNECNGVVSVVYLTTHPTEKLPTHVRINGTNKKSWAMCDQITTISKRRIGKYVGQCSPMEIQNLRRAICIGYTTDDLHMDKKEIIPIIQAWRDAMTKAYTEDEISEYPVENFETPDEPETKTETTAAESELKPEEPAQKIEEPVAQTIQTVDIETMPEYIRLKAERDMLEQMYKDLLVKTISR